MSEGFYNIPVYVRKFLGEDKKCSETRLPLFSNEGATLLKCRCYMPLFLQFCLCRELLSTTLNKF